MAEQSSEGLKDLVINLPGAELTFEAGRGNRIVTKCGRSIAHDRSDITRTCILRWSLPPRQGRHHRQGDEPPFKGRVTIIIPPDVEKVVVIAAARIDPIPNKLDQSALALTDRR